MHSNARHNFVLQQGFRNAPAAECSLSYPALMWQPRVVGVLALAGVIFQPWPLFVLLGCLLWWNALVPSLNPFDALHNRWVAARRGGARLTPAPGPRRFAQAMAGTFMLAIGAALFLGHPVVAWVLEGLLLVALGSLILGGFCLGSFLFLLLTGQGEYARKTLPWTPRDALHESDGSSGRGLEPEA